MNPVARLCVDEKVSVRFFSGPYRLHKSKFSHDTNIRLTYFCGTINSSCIFCAKTSQHSVSASCEAACPTLCCPRRSRDDAPKCARADVMTSFALSDLTWRVTLRRGGVKLRHLTSTAARTQSVGTLCCGVGCKSPKTAGGVEWGMHNLICPVGAKSRSPGDTTDTALQLDCSAIQPSLRPTRSRPQTPQNHPAENGASAWWLHFRKKINEIKHYTPKMAL